MWLELFEPLRTDHLQTGNTICRPSSVQFFQRRNFRLASRNHGLATHVVRDGMLATKANHRLRAFHTQLGLQRSWSIVKSGMNDTAVVPGLVRRNMILL